MYIEQLKNLRRSTFIYYIPMILFMAVIFIPQFLLGSPEDTTRAIAMMIEQFGKNFTFIVAVGPLAFLCVVLLLWVKFFHKQSITSLTTSRTKIDWKRVLFSFSIWGGFLLVSTIVMYLLEPERYLVQFNLVPFLIFFVLACLLLPLQTSFEEYFFRGYLMQGIGFAVKNRWMPLIITSVVFGLLHSANPEVGQMGMIMMVYYIGTGLLLGIMTLMDEGLELALGYHASNNLIGALLLTSDWSALQTNSVLKDTSTGMSLGEFIIPIILVYPLLLLVFARKYKWNNWKKKLTQFNDASTI